MKKTLLLLLLWKSALLAQVTIVIQSTPALFTPEADTLFLAGDFNNWNPGNATHRFIRQPNGTYRLTFTPNSSNFLCKVTRGNWATVEVTASGLDIPNRSLSGANGAIHNLSVAEWQDTKGSHSVTPQVSILQTRFPMPQFGRTRKIWLYLPTDYFTSTKTYPVLYLQDGQNVFDNASSFSGEWKVDETMNGFATQNLEAIVVAVDNGGSERINEYGPYINTQYGGGQGEKYVDFLVSNLKPYIDQNFRTRPEREFTAIGGSSLGANIAFFAALKNPDVFGKALIFSPAFWFSDSLKLFAQNYTKQFSSKIYFVSGQNESQTMVPKMQEMRNVLVSKGFTDNELALSVKADGAHSEWFWAREFGAAYSWLFAQVTDLKKKENTNSILIYPNPAKENLFLQTEEKGTCEFKIMTLTGQLIYSGSFENQYQLSTSQFPRNSTYFIQLVLNGKQETRKLFLK